MLRIVSKLQNIRLDLSHSCKTKTNSLLKIPYKFAILLEKIELFLFRFQQVYVIRYVKDNGR